MIRGNYYFFFFFLLADLVYFHNFLQGSQLLGRIDGFYQFFPYFLNFTENIKKFNIPMWWEYTALGYPFVGVIQSSVFYFPNYIFALLNSQVGYNLSVIFHFFLMQVAIFLLSREYLPTFYSFLSALFFSFSFYVLIHLDIATMIYAMPYFFLNLLIFHKVLHIEEKFTSGEASKKVEYIRKIFKYLLLSSFFIGMEFLAGYPQLLIYNVIYLTLLALFHSLINKKFNLNIFIFLFLSIVLAFPIIFVQYWSSLELANSSFRKIAKESMYSTGSLPPYMLLTYIFPYIFGGMGKLSYFGPEAQAIDLEFINHISILSIPLFIIGLFISIRYKKKEFIVLSLVGLVSLILSFGEYTLIHYLLYFLPGYSDLRVHCRNMIFFNYVLAVLSSLGLMYLIRLISINPKTIYKVIFYLFCILLISLICFLPLIFREFPFKEFLLVNLHNKQLFLFSFMILTAWIIVFFVSKNKKIILTTIPLIFLTETYIWFINMKKSYISMLPNIIEKKDLLISLDYFLKSKGRKNSLENENIILLNPDENNKLKNLGFYYYNISAVKYSQYYLNFYDPLMNKYFSLLFYMDTSGTQKDIIKNLYISNNYLLSIFSAKYILLTMENYRISKEMNNFTTNKDNKIEEIKIKERNFKLDPEKSIQLLINKKPEQNFFILKIKIEYSKENIKEKFIRMIQEKSEKISLLVNQSTEFWTDKKIMIPDKDNNLNCFIIFDEDKKSPKLDLVITNNFSKSIIIKEMSLIIYPSHSIFSEKNIDKPYEKILEIKNKENIVKEIWENKNSFPRIYSVENVKTMENFSEFVDYLYTLKVNFNKTCLVESENKELEKGIYSRAKIENLKFFQQKDTVEFETESNDPSFIVINVSYHKDWKCYLNNITQIPIFKTNGIVQGIIVPKGKNKITLKFEPPYKKYLSLPFIFSLLYLFLILIWNRKNI